MHRNIQVWGLREGWVRGNNKPLEENEKHEQSLVLLKETVTNSSDIY